MQYTKEVEEMICVAKAQIMVLHRFLKRENGYRRKRSRTSPVIHMVSAGALPSRVPASSVLM